MTIAELIVVLDVISQSGDLSREVVDITEDSRQVKPGALFVAVKGAQVDGHNFIATACQQGAVGILLESSFQRTSSQASRLLSLKTHIVGCQLDPSRLLPGKF